MHNFIFYSLFISWRSLIRFWFLFSLFKSNDKDLVFITKNLNLRDFSITIKWNVLSNKWPIICIKVISYLTRLIQYSLSTKLDRMIILYVHYKTPSALSSRHLPGQILCKREEVPSLLISVLRKPYVYRWF